MSRRQPRAGTDATSCSSPATAATRTNNTHTTIPVDNTKTEKTKKNTRRGARNARVGSSTPTAIIRDAKKNLFIIKKVHETFYELKNVYVWHISSHISDTKQLRGLPNACVCGFAIWSSSLRRSSQRRRAGPLHLPELLPALLLRRCDETTHIPDRRCWSRRASPQSSIVRPANLSLPRAPHGGLRAQPHH